MWCSSGKYFIFHYDRYTLSFGGNYVDDVFCQGLLAGVMPLFEL